MGGCLIYFLYLDETGTSRNENHFILGGTIIHSNDWKSINEEITKLKKRYFGTVYIDLKGLRKSKQIKISKNTFNPFYNLSEVDIKNFADSIFDILYERKLTFIASIINKNELTNKYGLNTRDPYLTSFEFLVERFDNFLKGYKDYGMIQIELGNKVLANNLRIAHENFLANGTDFQEIERIIESCNFVYGPKNNFTQLADLFINSVYRCVEYGKHVNYEKYKPYVRCSSNGNRLGYGIKYFPDIELNTIKVLINYL